MDKYDIVQLSGGNGRDPTQLVMILQHQLLYGLQTIVVAPLSEPTVVERTPRLRPMINLGERRLQLQVDHLAAIDKRQLGAKVGSAVEHFDRIEEAIGLLFNAF